MGEFLKAFVTFAAKGVEEVLAAGKATEQTTSGGAGKADVTFAAKGVSEVTAAADQIHAKTDRLKDAGKVEFKASGVDKVEGAANTIKQRLATIAQGGDFTRMLSGGVEHAFKEAGEAAGGMLAGGIGSALGGVLAGGVGGIIAGLIPGVGEMFKHHGEVAESKAKLQDRAESPEDAAKWMHIREEGYGRWKRTAAGPEGFNKGLDIFQREKLSPEQAEKSMNEIMVLAANSGKSPETMAEDYAKMLAQGSGRSRAAFAKSDDLIIDQIRKMVPGYEKGDAGETRLVADMTSGKISTATVQEAVHRAAVERPTLAGAGAEQRSTGAKWLPDMGDMREVGRDIYNLRVSTKGATPLNGAPGLEPVAPDAPWTNVPETMTGHESRQYGFTSLAGLAEKMQTEASGTENDAQERSAGYLETIVNQGVKIQPGTPGAAQPVAVVH